MSAERAADDALLFAALRWRLGARLPLRLPAGVRTPAGVRHLASGRPPTRARLSLEGRLELRGRVAGAGKANIGSFAFGAAVLGHLLPGYGRPPAAWSLLSLSSDVKLEEPTAPARWEPAAPAEPPTIWIFVPALALFIAMLADESLSNAADAEEVPEDLPRLAAARGLVGTGPEELRMEPAAPPLLRGGSGSNWSNIWWRPGGRFKPPRSASRNKCGDDWETGAACASSVCGGSCCGAAACHCRAIGFSARKEANAAAGAACAH